MELYSLYLLSTFVSMDLQKGHIFDSALSSIITKIILKSI